MTEKPNAAHATSLELEGTALRIVSVSLSKNKAKLERAFELNSEDVKPLYIDALSYLNSIKDSLIITSLSSHETLIRSLEVKLKKNSDVDAVLKFQAEPLLPFPLDKGVIDRIFLGPSTDGTLLTILAARKDHLEKHLNLWSSQRIEPEAVTSEAAALVCFANTFYGSDQPYLAVHLGKNYATCVLIKNKKLIAAQACLTAEADPEQTKLDILRTWAALEKKIKGIEVAEILFTGSCNPENKLYEMLLAHCQKASRLPDPRDGFDLSPELLQKYAIPLGAALSGLPNHQDPINFRNEEFIYPHPWKRYKKPLAAYLSLCLVLSSAFYFFGNAYIGYQEDEIRKEYVSLLGTMNKTYPHFENEYLAKFPSEKRGEEDRLIPPKELSQEEILGRIQYLQKEIQSTPDMFPLLPMVPRVSDVLAWLSNHPQVVKKTEDGSIEKLIQLESFNYLMVKRPEQTKKQEKYQVKVELEFSTATPKLAREFHDALIAANPIVDPKGEVKWSSNRGKYRTSFFLKDKTLYPR